MLNWTSISPAQWETTRQSLVLYFKYRGMRNPEDLAHDTLLAILRRKDYEFENEPDFPKVCHGFAKHILQQARREAAQEEGSIENMVVSVLRTKTQGFEGAELNIYLDELLQIGKEKLDRSDWDAIRQSMDEPGTQAAEVKKRVRLYRARERLARLVQWWRQKK